MSESPAPSDSPPLGAWLLLALAALAWGAAWYVAVFVVPPRVEVLASVGVDLPLATVAAINAANLARQFGYAGVGLGLAATGCAAAGVWSMGARGPWMVLFALLAIAGLAAAGGLHGAIGLGESQLVRQLDAPPTSLARAALPRRGEDALVGWREEVVGGTSYLAECLRLTVSPAATVAQVNALLAELRAIAVAGDPDAGWIVIRVDEAGAALSVASGRPEVGTAARIQAPAR